MFKEIVASSHREKQWPRWPIWLICFALVFSKDCTGMRLKANANPPPALRFLGRVMPTHIIYVHMQKLFAMMVIVANYSTIFE